ncbi:Chromobox protein 2 [Folsomia candida]|uniref:Chromobox protein 2 n=1 Tax=Folsomia candida TaxID=158441 RepID=A0A226DRF2_FOLCA|nr:Chromobox protein 2 [Folsomia candida]
MGLLFAYVCKQRGPEAEVTDYENYGVEEILLHLLNDNQEPEILIRWKGWCAEHDSWVTAENIKDSGDLLTAYMIQQTISLVKISLFSLVKINRKQCELFETKLVASNNQIIEARPSAASSASIYSDATSSIINLPVQPSFELLRQLVADWRHNLEEEQDTPASSIRSLPESSRHSYGDHQRSRAEGTQEVPPEPHLTVERNVGTREIPTESDLAEEKKRVDSWATAEDMGNPGDLVTTYTPQNTISVAKITCKQLRQRAKSYTYPCNRPLRYPNNLFPPGGIILTKINIPPLHQFQMFLRRDPREVRTGITDDV